MERMSVTPFQQALEVVEQLPLADQEALIEVIRLRLLKQRRSEIAANAEDTRQALREGRAKYGDVTDLRRDLLA